MPTIHITTDVGPVGTLDLHVPIVEVIALTMSQAW